VALDAMNGDEVWKFYTAPADGQPGADSWPATVSEDRRIASPWGVPGSYDPELGLTYWGVANPNPYTHLTRYATEIGLHNGVPREASSPSDLYSDSTIALNIDTGELAWYWQGLPADDWDADNNQERLLINTVSNWSSDFIKWINPAIQMGTERKIVLYNAEGGGQYAVDRATGEFLWGRPFPSDAPNVNMNNIDVKTGRTFINFGVVHQKDGDTTEECYHNTRNWWVSAFSPRTNSQYLVADQNCLRMTADATKPNGYGLRSGYIREGVPPEEFSSLMRIDVATGEIHIFRQSVVPSSSATLATAGGLVFSGDMLGRYRAFDDMTGDILWEGIVGGAITQSNITYMVDGKQYVMIYTGDAGGTGGYSTVRDLLPVQPVVEFNAIYVFTLP
jgi:alcohol dehydrogenase (cytochrome c)